MREQSEPNKKAKATKRPYERKNPHMAEQQQEARKAKNAARPKQTWVDGEGWIR
jgi:hypothetical protein